ncbi:SDR family NAD(P)-dependent oxidoreductase [Anianabacter salinae]|uniref:SDR family NAD(P)-dependent oxidoreductase n=1 Tax=Anianabacter salinae TaxID=2851023 RepID=UPI00225E2D30|nr:SDR family NAD(P)-dependent oxidoreductase [Anianabacter salinae]MBV0913330.1 SDR family NAD(P)-dependent oxidoreductase [Anianabacter salinae]
MIDWSTQRYWLIGASAGLGRALAHQMSRAGCELIVSARSEDDLKALVDELPGRASYVTVDAADQEAVEAAARDIGEIDGMVLMAGVYWPLGASDWDTGKNLTMLDVNAGGAIRAVGAVLPDMLKRGRGHIVLPGSLSGFRGLPGATAYGMSKAAVMYMAESLHADLKGTGVRVQVVNPGFIKTRLTEKNDFKMPMIMEPEDGAREIFEHMGTDRFKKGFPWAMSTMFRASQFLPDWAYYRLFSSKG